MIEYEFYRNEDNKLKIKLSKSCKMLAEWTKLSSTQFDEAIVKMDEIRSGKKESYEFGYDMTIYIYENGRSYLWYDYPKKEMNVPFEDIYNLMKDWRDYIDAWEKETDKVKK